MKLVCIIAATAFIVVFGLWIAARQTRLAPVSSTDDPDGSVISQLVQAGADLTKAHRPEFFLYLPDKSAAERVAGTLRADGFQAEVRRGALGDSWLCLATKEMVLTHETMAKLRMAASIHPRRVHSSRRSCRELIRC
jgi:hypothetical protein